MAVTHKQLIPPTLISGTNGDPVVPAELYAVPNDVRTQVRALSVHNPSAGAITLMIFLGEATQQIEKKAIASGETYLCIGAINQILEAQDKILVAGDGLRVLCSGAEIS